MGRNLQPVAELDGNGNVVSRFVYAEKVNVPEYVIKSSGTYRLITDHLGSVRLVVNTATGAVAQEIEYDAFGNVLVEIGAGFQPLGFAGGVYDTDTKLTRFGARDYDAHAGRWTAKDPIRFIAGDPSLYGYALADPVNHTDPTGYSAVEQWAFFFPTLVTNFGLGFFTYVENCPYAAKAAAAAASGITIKALSTNLLGPAGLGVVSATAWGYGAGVIGLAAGVIAAELIGC